MKASDKPQISKKWWTSEKPSEVKGTDLEKALSSAEKALADEKKKSDGPSIEACLKALEELESAVDRTIKKELDKKKHKDVITVLEKYAGLIAAETSRLEKLQAQDQEGEGEEDEDEEDEGKIFEPEYLYKMMKLLKSTGKELNFGFGLNPQNPSASKLVLTRKGKPERLFKALKKTGEFSNRLLTYGTAVPDQQDSKTLVFKLAESAGEPPQIQKMGRVFLRNDKNLKFRKLKLVLPGGQTLDDNEPDTEDAAGGASQQDLGRELSKIDSLIAAWQQALGSVTAQIERLRKAIDGQNQASLRPVSDGLGKVMSQFPDLDLSKLAAAARSNDRSAYDRTLSQTTKEVRDVYKMLAQGPLLSTIDENPFVKTNVHPTIEAVLSRVSSELGA